MPTLEKFMSRCMPEPNTGCWLWLGTFRSRDGYGYFSVSHTKRKLAHRASWEFHRGPIPSGIFVCHKCDTPACVNPDHLFLGTHSENMIDMRNKGRAGDLRGESCHQAKLTPEAVREIRSSVANGTSYRTLGKQYGVTFTCISAIMSGRSWRHVE